MTFTGQPHDLERLRKGISFGVTAPDDVRPVAETLVRDLGGSIEWIAEDRRTLYHAALAHGANHLVTLVNEAMDRLREAGAVNPAQGLDPLLHAALDNALAPGGAALTGPVSRGDAGTVPRHLRSLPAAAGPASPAPTRPEMYPHGEPLVRVNPGPLGEILEGASRPGFFHGVLTVVSKLLHLTRPDAAYYGEKDYQQLTLIRLMARDLDLPVDIRG